MTHKLSAHKITTTLAMAPTNNAAVLVELNKPFDAQELEIVKPGKNEVLVRNHAVAMNPVDWMMQGGMYPANVVPRVLGNDVAGQIVEVGEGVTAFKKGDRVLGHCILLMKEDLRYGGFQEYTVIDTTGCAKIPDSMEYKDACVLPLAISTAAMGLFLEQHLGLDLPSADKKKPSNKTLLVWGGSSSVGTAAIQLAVAAGYKVIATSSKRNFDLCKSIGASEVFDHSSPSIVGDLTAVLKKGEFVGAYDAISTRDTQLNVATIVAQFGGGTIAATLPPPEEIPANVDSKMVMAAMILTKEEGLGKAIYNNFLESALADGVVKPAPPADVVGHGVESMQKAVDKLKAGVSGAKIVVTL
jgi:NADPH:quinone reductase-like Zn-dependent oxidoreductase